MTKITANNHSIAVGRDLTINLVFDETQKLDVEHLLYQIQGLTGFERDHIVRSMGYEDANDIEIESIARSLQAIFADAGLQQSSQDKKYLLLAQSAKYVQEAATTIEGLAKQTHDCLSRQDYAGLYQNLSQLMEHPDLPDSARKSFSSDYLQAGFLHFSAGGNSEKMHLFIEYTLQNYASLLAPTAICTIAEIQQEHATRQPSEIPLRQNLNYLMEIEPSDEFADDLVEYWKLLYATCLRRLGERGDSESLTRAIELSRDLLANATARPIGIRSNLGICLLRHYEATGDVASLQEVNSVLSGISLPEKQVLLTEYRAFPTTLNNNGNYYKQMLRLTENTEYLTSALEKYTQAEQFWSERHAPFEWAMLQKNKAETRLFALSHGQFSREFIETGIKEARSALQYRTETHAPYQHNKTKAVLDALLQH